VDVLTSDDGNGNSHHEVTDRDVELKAAAGNRLPRVARNAAMMAAMSTTSSERNGQ